MKKGIFLFFVMSIFFANFALAEKARVEFDASGKFLDFSELTEELKIVKIIEYNIPQDLTVPIKWGEIMEKLGRGEEIEVQSERQEITAIIPQIRANYRPQYKAVMDDGGKVEFLKTSIESDVDVVKAMFKKRVFSVIVIILLSLSGGFSLVHKYYYYVVACFLLMIIISSIVIKFGIYPDIHSLFLIILVIYPALTVISPIAIAAEKAYIFLIVMFVALVSISAVVCVGAAPAFKVFLPLVIVFTLFQLIVLIPVWRHKKKLKPA